ncbi:MAG: iron ABC transporter permease [Tissierellia bacterium]|nr:iron ABC transporter permease [Tissierellia bacterium]
MANKKSTVSKGLFLIISLCLLVMSFIIAIGVGSVSIKVSEIIQVFKNIIPFEDVRAQILWNVRLPRAIMAIIIGANLAVAGALLQSVMQNPLADPGIIGVSSGASLAAVTILILFPGYANFVPLAAFFGGLAATGMVYILAWKGGIKPVRLVLSGVAINALLGGLNSLISVLNSDKIQSVVLWINGSLAGRHWNDLLLLLKYSVVGLVLSLFCIRSANIMLLGDEKATNLGLNVHKARLLLSVLGAYLAGISTALVGVIGFVGLVIPHISRLIVGSDYRVLLPFSMINGGMFLLVADTFARTVANPVELPVGTLMAVIGAPFFLYLLRKEHV